MICGISAAVYGIVFSLFSTMHIQSELELNIKLIYETGMVMSEETILNTIDEEDNNIE